MIVFIIDSYIEDPSKGGPPRAIHTFAQYLSKNYEDLHVISSNIGLKEFSKNKIIDNVKVKYFKTLSNYLATKNKQFTFGIYFWTLINNKNIDLIILNQVRGFTPLFSYLIAKFFKIPILLFPFGMAPQKKGLLRIIFDYLYTNNFMQYCSVIFCQSFSEKNEIHKIFKIDETKLEVLPLPYNKINILEYEKNNYHKKEYILFLGRLDFNKGIDRLIKLYEELKKKNFNKDLVICGSDDGFKKYLEAMIHNSEYTNNIKLIDPIFDDSRYKLYENASAFIMCSRIKEETSLASVEALSTGTPAILNSNLEVPFLDEASGVIYIDEILKKIDNNINISETEYHKINDFISNFKQASKKNKLKNIIEDNFSIESIGRNLDEIICREKNQ